VAGRAVWGQGLAAWGQQRDEAGDVHDRVQPGALRGPKYQLGAADIHLADAAGVAAVQGIDRAGVHHRLAARHRLVDYGRVGDIPHDCVQVGGPYAKRCNRGRHPVSGANQQPHMVAMLDQGRNRVGADETGPTGDQNAHVGLLPEDPPQPCMR
jgi:hypothetical protein